MNVEKVFVIIIFFVFSSLFSQNIRHLSVDEGLPQSFVSGIVEDEKGFIWVSTRNGLARYDGHVFKIYQNNPSDKKTPASNIITHIKKGKGNNLFIQYETGETDKFSFETETATHIINANTISKYRLNPHRRVWIVANNNVVWFKTKDGRLCTLDYNDGGEPNYTYDILKGYNIYNVLEDKNNTVWILTEKALFRFKEKQKKFLKISIPENLHFSDVVTENFCPFFERENGELLWSDKNTVYIFNPDTRSFRQNKLPVHLDHNVKWAVTNGNEYFISNNTIYSFSEAKGIHAMSTVELSGNRQAQAFLVDRSGLIWVGGDAQGVYTIDTSVNFKTFEYESDFTIDLLEQEYGISASAYFGLEKYRAGGLSPSYFLRTAWYNQKHWIALNRTVCYYDAANKISKLPVLPETGKKFAPILGISFKQNGAPVVIDRENSIYSFDSEKQEWQLIISLNSLKTGGDQKLVPSDMHIDIRNNTAWIATEAHGLIVLSLASKKITQIKSEEGVLPTNNLIEIMPDKENNNIIWIGSTAGLIQFNKRDFHGKVFSIKEGLPDNVIYSILQDKNGKLWMGTNKGLVVFNPKDFKSRVFKRSHGLTNIEFNRFHKVLLADGRMVFGSSGSGIIFNPEDITEDTYAPVTVFTGIKLNNENIRSLKPDFPPVHTLKTLRLSYLENTLSFTYSALQYNQPDDIKYRYRLIGYDKNWVMAGRNREAVYTKLPPGDYTFEVNASNTSGIWSDSISTVGIMVAPPWWKTWWAKAIYIIIIILVILWFINFRVNREVEKNKVQLKIKEAEELRKLDTVKNRFFSNVAHEFRTPLTLILGPAEQLKESNRDEDSALLNIIAKNTTSLLNLTDQLLDIAKLEAGVLKPQMVWGDVIPVISNIIKVFTEEAVAKKVTLIMNAPQSAEFLFSINTLDRIFYNLLSNALKFTSPGGTIQVAVIKDNDGLSLKIKDSGKGIPKDEIPNVFNRYYKNADQNPYGTGIGLSLVQELVELHQGTVTVESSVADPSWTLFSIWLPLLPKEEVVVSSLPVPENNQELPLVLVVDDHKELANFVAGSLKQYYDVIIANNGQEALEYTLSKMPDIIVSDVSMEPMNGFEFCEAVKKDINISHIPVILLTAKADMESKLEGLSFGANDYVTKPFSVPELNLRIRNLLELQKKQREHLFKDITRKEKTGTVEDKFLKRIYAITEDNLDDKDFSVDELAAALHMSRSSLHRKTKTLFDLPASEIIKIYRLNRASEFLKNGFNVSEAAYMTGFNTPSYFSKCFKAHFNVSPAEYTVK